MAFKSYREESRISWGIDAKEGETLNGEQIQLGAILRIADSLEKIERSYASLLSDVKYYKELAKSRSDRIDQLKKTNAALKAWVTRLKRKDTK